MQNGTAIGALDLSNGDSQSHGLPQKPNGTESGPPNGRSEAAATDGASLEADGTSAEGDVAASFFDPGSCSPGLQIDPDAHGEQEGTAHSVYAFSTYPRIQAAFQVEHPFDSLADTATM